MNLPASLSPANIALENRIVRSHFSTQAEVQQLPLLAWRDRVGHVIDVVLPPLSELGKPFQASIDRYQVGAVMFTDCRSDMLVLERTMARISRDKLRDFSFLVFLEGNVENVSVRVSGRGGAPSLGSILAIDMSQPIRMKRNACRVINFFVPGELVQEVFPDPGAIHGRTIHGTTPLTRLIIQHVATLAQSIGCMSADEADGAIRAAAQLLVAAFGKQARLSGNARSAARAAMFGQVRRYIQSNLYEADLSPERVLDALQLPRRTLYRLFEHEGGLGSYIRHLRLRRAADDLACNPNMTVTNIAYGLGFKSASDFTRAFRRAYEMAPQDFRALVGTVA
ncbi:AraC-like DNA-binding protein [Paraburkholderia sp. WSM4175]|uniref:helix-turn-helix domain-containing protein n=1 Tax=Paraburkholderia sp. WSM4175 TaxID=2991072 RepID=UPI003D2187D8